MFESPSFPTPPSYQPPPDGMTELDAESVHVWRVELSRPQGALQELRALLSLDERERADRFRFDRDRDRFTVARATLRSLIGRYLGREPASLSFEYLDHGKPALADGQSRDGLAFNVSHSADLALIAFARQRDAGIDVEAIRPDRELLGIASRFFCPREVECLEAAGGDALSDLFFAFWTRKEAYLKARGVGLAGSLQAIDVSRATGEDRIDLQVAEPSGDDRRSWCLVDLPVDDGFRAALCAERMPREICLWSAAAGACG